MEPLRSGDFLSVWEQARGLHAVDQALALLAAGCPGVPHAELASLSLGERDARLLSLREETFGEAMEGVVDCPRCGQRLEFIVSTWDVCVPPEEAEPSHEVNTELGPLRFRPLNSYDIAAIAGLGGADEGRRLLAHRSLIDHPTGGLTDDIVDALASRLAECDPQAEVLLELRCPECGETWRQALDIASFLWTEVSAAARRLLREVDTLARAYGWGEADILGLSPGRRQLYLEMVS